MGSDAALAAVQPERGGGQQSRCHSPEATPQLNAAHGEANETRDPARDAHASRAAAAEHLALH